MHRLYPLLFRHGEWSASRVENAIRSALLTCSVEDLPVQQQTGIFGVRAERIETEINEARAMELEAQVFEAERARAGGRT